MKSSSSSSLLSEPLHPAGICIYNERVKDVLDSLENHDARQYISVVTGT